MDFKNLSTVLFLFLLLGSCTEKEPLKTSESLFQFREYIADVSKGKLSAFTDIRIVLRQPVAGWTEGKILDKNWLHFSPEISGELTALNAQTLSFKPEKPLVSGQKYRAELALKKIIPDVKSEFKIFPFEIRVIEQDFVVQMQQLQSYSRDWQYAEGTLQFSDIINAVSAKKVLTALQNDHSLAVKINADSNTLSASFPFTVDSIQRLEETTQVLVKWKGEPLKIDTRGETTITIPGKNQFSVTSVLVHNETAQSIEVNFSDPIDSSQNLAGLVSLDTSNKFNLVVEGNLLKIFPANRLKGNVRLEIFQGIKSAEGYGLKKAYKEDLLLEEPKPEARWLSNGVLLPASTDLKVNFEAVSLRAVDVKVYKIHASNVLQFLQDNTLKSGDRLRYVATPVAGKVLLLDNNTGGLQKWQAHALDLSKIMQPEPGAMYRVELNFKKEYSAYSCGGAVNAKPINTNALSSFADDAKNSKAWTSLEEYYDYEDYDDYDWRERENPCHNTYYYDRTSSVNLLATDLGLTVKRGAENQFQLATSNLITGQPEGNVKVTFFDLQKQTIQSVTTNLEGLANTQLHKDAAFAVAENGAHKNYLRLYDGEALSVSKFDVAGKAVQKGIKGYIFGERGVWRPGDTLFLSFILNDKANPLPPGQPAVMEVSDPYGKIIYRKAETNPIDKFYTFTVVTDPNAQTGAYRAKVKVGGLEFVKNLRIETIKPNRLRIQLQFAKQPLQANTSFAATLSAAWLHGAKAGSLKADVGMKLRAKSFNFQGFNDFVFSDPLRSIDMDEIRIFEGSLNENGTRNFTYRPNLGKTAPGMLEGIFLTKVYESGGDFSQDVATADISPYETYVGLRIPKGKGANGELYTDASHRFEVVTLNQDGKGVHTENLKVAIYKIRWRWWWQTGSDNLSAYSSSELKEKVFETNLNTNEAGKGSFQFTLKYPEWGRYLIRVEDPNGGHAAGATTVIDWPEWLGKPRKGDPSSATFLSVQTDKKEYVVGETVKLTFPSSLGGRALITVENGTKVLDAFWVTPTEGTTRFDLPLKAGYTPNVYVHVSSLQPHAQTRNDLPIRLYGIIPVQVTDPSTKLTPVLSLPESLEPEQRFTLKILEKNKKPMTYNLAIVDEGLLDLTRYATPNPWDEFFAREALGVTTWDVFDDVVGAYGGRINQVFAIGGDENMAGANNKKANRFKPMVIVEGPFVLDAGQTRSHTFKVPKYIGSVRVMVVAAHTETHAYGNAEKAVAVKKPLMLLASAPRKVSPGEKITLPVTVFAMDKKVKNVKVKIITDPAFSLVDGDERQLTFTEPGEKMTFFEVVAGEKNQPVKFKFEAVSGSEKANYEFETDVLNPNPVTFENQRITINGKEKQVINLVPFGVNGSNTAKVEFSTLPPLNFSGRLDYLISYPHGCVEQITSSVFPQLYLDDLFDISKERSQKIQSNVELALQKLKAFQLPGGGFSYWPGLSDTSDWGTTYLGHFILEAEKSGYVLPIGMKQQWLAYQQKAAKNWRKNNSNAYISQAYRLYTLALAGIPDLASMNRLRQNSSIDIGSRFRLAAAYALSGQKSAASDLIAQLNYDYQSEPNDYYSYSSETRNKAMALETYLLVGQVDKSRDLVESLSKTLNSDQWLSTQSTAFALYATARFAEAAGGKNIDAQYTFGGKTHPVKSSKALAGTDLNIGNQPHVLSVENLKEGVLYATVTLSGQLPVGSEKTLQKNLKASVVYKGTDGKPLSIGKLMQGTNFYAEITIANTRPEAINDLALSAILPGGWEIINTRFTDYGTTQTASANYTDIRDDRVNLYFDLKKSESKTFVVQLNASYLGKYYLPGLQCEAMYDSNFSVRTSGQWVEVVQ